MVTRSVCIEVAIFWKALSTQEGFDVEITSLTRRVTFQSLGGVIELVSVSKREGEAPAEPFWPSNKRLSRSFTLPERLLLRVFP